MPVWVLVMARTGAAGSMVVGSKAFPTPIEPPPDMVAWLKIEDVSGNQLAQSDDIDGGRDPRLGWKASTNGNYIIAIGSVTHRGGRDYCYRLTARRVLPDFTARLAAGGMDLTPGKTNELKLDLKRLRGLTNELALRFLGLPAGITALTTNLAGKDGSLPIRFAAALEAPKSQGPVELFVMDTTTGKERVVPFDLTTRGETGFNHLLVETAGHFWLTVLPKPEPKPESKPKPAK